MLNAVQSSLLNSHAARATIRPARFVRMRTIVVAQTIITSYPVQIENVIFTCSPAHISQCPASMHYNEYEPYHNVWPEAIVVVLDM